MAFCEGISPVDSTPNKNNVRVSMAWCHRVNHFPWWRHQLETFSALQAFCAGNSPVTGEFPAQRPVTRSFDFSLMCAWINGSVNNREAGDLRRHRAHYDVIAMLFHFRDTAGMEDVHLWTEPSYRGVMGILLVYDVTNAKTFDSISNWLRNIDEVSMDIWPDDDQWSL